MGTYGPYAFFPAVLIVLYRYIWQPEMKAIRDHRTAEFTAERAIAEAQARQQDSVANAISVMATIATTMKASLENAGNLAQQIMSTVRIGQVQTETTAALITRLEEVQSRIEKTMASDLTPAKAGS